ncbi:protein disulfide-isomerase A6-like [Styela clava]
MMKALGFLLALVSYTSALYSSGDDVVELTSANFKSKVLDSDELWLVEFYAPWCGHCQQLVPAWKKAAKTLKGVANVGAVDMTAHDSVGRPYGIQGFPTIKVFGYNKNKPTDYQGARSEKEISDFAFQALRKMVQDRESGGAGDDQEQGKGRQESGGNAVVTLNDNNFKELVLDSDEPWLVEFYAPWCGHCKRLEPEWKAAANKLKNEVGDAVRMGAVDATVSQSLGNKYGVRGYPTIKVFRKGAKESPEDFQGGRDSSSIFSAAMELYEENVEPPTIDELISAKVQEDNCIGKQLCVISFLADILDTGAKGRNEALELLTTMGEKFKKKQWGWVWTEAGKQKDLEKALNIGGSGFPAMAVIVDKKKFYTVLTGPFNNDGIESFLNGISYGRAGRNSHALPDSQLPNVVDCSPWDGKDGQLPQEEEVDLSDFKWDDEL